ncbi:transcriptional regulator, XRE family [Candidatus Koribacter versatilis Ellin345]|uniref:Transcriptional regulator, XRE family n=1 Tax=Koribacter versatilis (strain Ellin345) TaxID=204669 RepID=Q1IVE0_KORVE|nr:helix-turn-helix domain-containing protein [Candidatus Koribacter versatilis]ABF39160.1 transcriptional regulator, XRE family [Candidatus Koribacter versatilis Ellin345]
MDEIARTSKQLGALLRKTRKSLGLTQADLASRIDVRQATISDLEHGEREARLGTVLQVLAALDLELVVRTRTRGDAKHLEDLF